MLYLRYLVLIVVVCLHLAGVLFVMYLHQSRPASTSFSVLSVGQGDAVLIKTASGQNILIDTGPDAQVLSALDEMMTLSERSIDLIFLTHPHADHIGGFLDVIRRYQVGGVVMSNVRYSSVVYEQMLRVIQQEHLRLWWAEASVDWQLSKDMSLDILYPFSLFEQERQFKNVNNASVVMMLKTPHWRCLLTGDMEAPLEQILGDYYGVRLQADCLKAAHHGSKTSSFPGFLGLVRPSEIFISVGRRNRFHHPAEVTVNNLQHWGVVKRTDEVGTITKKLL
ncbi:MBL fold metallo-hydrolase [Candidatus Gracilibacteria bacterium]|nr:MBL fold metallo-hydrolase [Candidatus Gracilibacteria bacterium]